MKKSMLSMLTEEQYEALLSDAAVEEYAAKARIFEEGGPGDSLYSSSPAR